MTVADVARILKINEQTVRNWIDRGELPAFHVGRRVRVRREDFEALLERSYTGKAASKSSSFEGIWSGEIPPPVFPAPEHFDDDRR